jgi:uncharacterized cupredoxin-like copper-binding protein
MRIRRILMILALGLAAGLVLAACGGGNNGGSTSGSTGKTISVDATEFSFSPNAYTAKVGEQLTFKVTNKGTVDHTFVIMNPDGSGKELAKITMKPGETQTLDFTPSAAGTYPVECDLPGHKEAGMTATLTVTQ